MGGNGSGDKLSLELGECQVLSLVEGAQIRMSGIEAGGIVGTRPEDEVLDCARLESAQGVGHGKPQGELRRVGYSPVVGTRPQKGFEIVDFLAAYFGGGIVRFVAHDSGPVQSRSD